MLLVFPQTRKAGIMGSFLIDVAADRRNGAHDFFETLSPKPYNL